jgi:hypothetical protein
MYSYQILNEQTDCHAICHYAMYELTAIRIKMKNLKKNAVVFSPSFSCHSRIQKKLNRYTILLYRLFTEIYFSAENLRKSGFQLIFIIDGKPTENYFCDSNLMQKEHSVHCTLFIIYMKSKFFSIFFSIQDLDTRIIIGSFSHELAPKIFCEVSIIIPI